MTDTRKLSLCITTYNRPELTLLAFEQVLGDHRIDEIIILDDMSTKENFDRLLNILPKDNKVYVYQQNGFNQGMSRTKRDVINLARNEWCILLDSDNIIDSSYIDAVFKSNVDNQHIILCPSFGKPSFDCTRYQGFDFNRFNIKYNLADKSFHWLLNMCNYVVHRQQYLDSWVENKDVGQADTIWHNYNHLKNGGRLEVVKEMHYYHRVHEGSGWNKDVAANRASFNKTLELIRQL